MVKCSIISNKNADLNSQRYLEEFPEQRQPNPRIFKRLYDNMYNSESPPRHYTSRKVILQEKILNVIGNVTVDPNISSRGVKENIMTRSMTLHI